MTLTRERYVPPSTIMSRPGEVAEEAGGVRVHDLTEG
jgi:hypothetical protein